MVRWKKTSAKSWDWTRVHLVSQAKKVDSLEFVHSSQNGWSQCNKVYSSILGMEFFNLEKILEFVKFFKKVFYKKIQSVQKNVLLSEMEKSEKKLY